MTLGEVVKIERSTADSNGLDPGLPYLGLENVVAHGDIAEASTLSRSGVKGVVARYGPSHVLYGKLRPYLNKVVAPEHEGACSTEFLPLLPSKNVDRRYLLHWLRSPSVVEQASRLVAGANLPRLSPSTLLSFEFPCPPLPEQRHIADILDRADALKRKRQQALQLADDFLRATFLDMFGDPSKNPKGWPTAHLADVVAPGTIVTYGIVQAGPHLEIGVPYIRTGDIKDGQIVESQLLKTSEDIASKFDRSRVSSGDIVMSIRATVGTVARVTESLAGANLTQGTARISPGPKTEGRFLLGHLKTAGTQRWIEESVKGATFREITLGRLRQLPVMLPPLDLQTRFSNVVTRVEAIVERSESFPTTELSLSLQSLLSPN